MTEQAINKLDTEFKDCKGLSKKGAAVSSAVLNVLKNFCTQNAEFSQAVVQMDKPIKDCIESTVKDCGNVISDIEVYRKAVQFYFPGADIRFAMTIELGDDGYSNDVKSDEQKPSGLHLSLDELLDF